MDLFIVFAIVCLVSVLFVISLTATVLYLLKIIKEQDEEIESLQAPF